MRPRCTECGTQLVDRTKVVPGRICRHEPTRAEVALDQQQTASAATDR
jgi:hypothetical protein